MTEKTHTEGKQGFRSLKNGSTNPQEVAAYYDEWAETYDATLAGWDYQAPNDAAATLAAHLKPSGKILDVGCGTGLFGRALKQDLVCRLHGIDISGESLKIATQQRIYERLMCHDLSAIPLPLNDGAFDAAACVGVLTYIEDGQRLLADLCRVVRPGGHILFTQRDDRWREQDYPALIGNLQARRLWTPVKISDAKPYLPNNQDFADRIRVIHVLCQVL